MTTETAPNSDDDPQWWDAQVRKLAGQGFPTTIETINGRKALIPTPKVINTETVLVHKVKLQYPDSPCFSLPIVGGEDAIYFEQMTLIYHDGVFSHAVIERPHRPTRVKLEDLTAPYDALVALHAPG